MNSFLLTFIPLFVAIDPLGTLPLFLSLTEGLLVSEKRRHAVEAMATALILGIVFTVGGHLILSLLGITSADFKIAGGLLLLIFSIREIFGFTSKRTEGAPADHLMGIVPLGIPLIMGPATITTLLILREERGYPLIVTALAANLLISLTVFLFSERIIRLVGEAVFKVTAKVVGIFLAAIGIMMIRKGVEVLIGRPQL